MGRSMGINEGRGRVVRCAPVLCVGNISRADLIMGAPHSVPFRFRPIWTGSHIQVYFGPASP